ncbi:MAG: NAD(P)/FAD-dependent oxidoreductase [Gammaproteobacteria bacterium]|nr:NAD(P)/FAD-dependent oxidoreductase [Gammaproteobacteria bacterium]
MDTFDVIILGGGPAGCQCALWLQMFGYRPCIIESRPHLGGLQNDNPYPDLSLVALPVPTTGKVLAARMDASIRAQDIPVCVNTRAAAIRTCADGFDVECRPAAPSPLHARFLVVATGVQRRSGGIDACENVIIGPGDRVYDFDFTGKRVAILGGGDNAFENYFFIRTRGAQCVNIFARSISARRQFLVRTDRTDVACGDYSLSRAGMRVNGRQYDVWVVMYGWEPNTSFDSDFILARKADGFIATDPETAETSINGVYAIGEIARRMHPSCVTSLADGATAAKAIQVRFEAGYGRAFSAQLAHHPDRSDAAGNEPG